MNKRGTIILLPPPNLKIVVTKKSCKFQAVDFSGQRKTLSAAPLPQTPL